MPTCTCVCVCMMATEGTHQESPDRGLDWMPKNVAFGSIPEFFFISESVATACSELVGLFDAWCTWNESGNKRFIQRVYYGKYLANRKCALTQPFFARSGFSSFFIHPFLSGTCDCSLCRFSLPGSLRMKLSV